MAPFRLKSDLPREIQERLFDEVAADDATFRQELALYLHNNHARTARSPKPLATMR